jgi:hypothetical protein
MAHLTPVCAARRSPRRQRALQGVPGEIIGREKCFHRRFLLRGIDRRAKDGGSAGDLAMRRPKRVPCKKAI